MKTLPLVLASLLLVSTPALAEIKLDNVQAFETSEGMKNGAVLLSITNTGAEDDTLVSASSTIAAKTEVHEMSENNGIMKMQKVDTVLVKAGETVTFKPDGYHIMVMGLKAPLKAGEEFPLSLTFNKAGTVNHTVGIVSRAPIAAEHQSHEHH